jgi:hypothetical protein
LRGVLGLILLTVLRAATLHQIPTLLDVRVNQTAAESRLGPIPSDLGKTGTPVDLRNHATDAHEPKETFSQLTLFLFGSGLALFVALLGWSEQIRGMSHDTRDLERQFLEITRIKKKDFLSIVKPTSHEERLAALTQALVSGKPKTVEQVEVLGIFTKWHRKWTGLEALYAWKYRLTLVLTWTLFAAGVASLHTSPEATVSLPFIHARLEVLILAVPMVLILAVLVIIVAANLREGYFSQLLNELGERL